jgi:site-specific DNA-methyltransferase (adenine-specific)
VRTNILYFGDNLEILRDRDRIAAESIDLIYLDPPFNSKKDYNLIFADARGERSTSQVEAFEDSWRWGEEAEATYQYLANSGENRGRVPPEVSRLIGALRHGIGDNDVMAYLVMMTVRLIEMHTVLKRSGSIYLHCDPAASHYLKIVMDAIFGATNFRREIVWRSGWVSGFKARARNWVRNHDILLYYVKDLGGGWTFNKDLAYVPHPPGYQRRGGGENPRGTAIEDVWTDIYSPWIMSFSTEKLGWPTQKPVALLKRIVEISSKPGDVVLDPFCGCGTALAACEELRDKRHWIGIDITPLAIAVIKDRMRAAYGLVDIPVDGEPADLEGARALAAGDDGRYRFQWWAVGKIGARPVSDAERKRGADKGIDGELTFTDGDGSEVQRILISVKSGGVSRGQVGELRGTVEREGAAIGIFISLNAPTKQMEEEAIKAGWYDSPLWRRRFRRIQLLTAADLIAERRGDLPPSVVSGMRQAAKVKPTVDQLGLTLAAEELASYGDSD